MDIETIIEKITDTFFEKLWINIENTNIIKNQEDIFLVKIKTSDSSLLIWQHWKNLEAIKLILKILISKKIWKKIKIQLEINDYIHNKDQKLFQLISKKIDLLKKSNNSSLKLPFFNAYERKKIHTYVMDLKDGTIYTKSDWEWKERRLYLYKSEKKLTIDIDWDDI